MTTSPPFPPSTGLVAYLRDSGGEEQELSVIQQRAEILQWAGQHSYTLLKFYIDEARPGSSTVTRTAFKTMVADLRRKDPNAQA